jgi:hypothetical protein
LIRILLWKELLRLLEGICCQLPQGRKQLYRCPSPR